MFHSVCDSSMSLGGQISVSIDMGKRALDSLSNTSIRWIVQWSLVDPLEKDAMRDVAKSQSITLPKVIFSQITSEDFAGKRQAYIPSQMTSSAASLDRHWSGGLTFCVLGLWDYKDTDSIIKTLYRKILTILFDVSHFLQHDRFRHFLLSTRFWDPKGQKNCKSIL